MRDAETWIKLNRNMTEWRWYKDQNTKALFIHLLFKANIEDKDFRDITIHRGELITTYAHLAEETGLSVQNIRTAMNHLKSTGELTTSQRGKNLVISIPEYSRYQDNLTGNQHDANTELTGNQHRLKNIRNKEYKNNPPISPLEEDEEFQKARMMLLGRRYDERRN